MKKQALDNLSGEPSEGLTEKQWENEAKALRKKVAGYKSYVSQTSKTIDDYRRRIENYEKEDIRQTVLINSLEERVKELFVGNNKAVEALNLANEEIAKLRHRLQEIADMPWWERIFLKP